MGREVRRSGISAVATEITQQAIKAKTDLLPLDYFYKQLLPRRGISVQGTWQYTANALCTEFLTDLKTDTAGYWNNNTTHAINDEYAYPLVLPAGTYSIEIYYAQALSASPGIGKVALGTTEGTNTFDCYAGASAYNQIVTNSIVLASSAAVNLRIYSNTKNVLSAGYELHLQKCTLWRTA